MAQHMIAEHTAQAVTQAMAAGHVSWRDLSERTGIPYTTLRNKLVGAGTPTVVDVYLIAKALGVSALDLLPVEMRSVA